MWRYNLLFILIPIIGFAQDSDILPFPHQLHIEDLELTCEVCHSAVEESNSLEARLLPDGETCADCHGETVPFNISELFTTDFSHQIHTEPFECQTCHAEITDDSIPFKTWSSSDCQNCHSKVTPEYHTLEWSSLHGLELNANTEKQCQLCHQKETCDQCHQLQQFTQKVHIDGFILSHAFDARSGILDCSNCHELVQDCYTCHVQNQVMPMNHNFPNWVGKNIVGGGLHSSLALDEPEVCQTCHLPATDRNCLKCH